MGKKRMLSLTFDLPLITDSFKTFEKLSFKTFEKHVYENRGKIYLNLNCSEKWVCMILKLKNGFLLCFTERENSRQRDTGLN